MILSTTSNDSNCLDTGIFPIDQLAGSVQDGDCGMERQNAGIRNGNELIDATRKLRPDVIVADIAMPIFFRERLHATGELSISRRLSSALFFLQNANELRVRRARNHTVKL